MSYRTLFIVGVLCVVATAPSSAQVPAKMSYQGSLLDSGGNPVTATVDLTFSIWDASACGGGALKWGPEVHSGVVVANGVFTVLLGDAGMPLTDPPLAFDAPCWLEIEVGTDPPLCPRVELVAVPAALMARTVEDGAITASKIADDAVTKPKLAANVISSEKILDGQVMTNDLADEAVTSDKIQDFTVTADDLADGAVTKSKLAPGAINPSNLALPFSATVSDLNTLWDLTNTSGTAGRFKTSSTSPALITESSGSGPALVAEGSVEVGSFTETGQIEVFRSGVAHPLLTARSSTHGGEIQGVDEIGHLTYGLGADSDVDGGGVLVVNRKTFLPGLLVDGNADNSGSTRLSLFGESETLDLDMSTSGDSSVSLPADAIASPEVLDEPGVASRTSNPAGGIALTGTTSDLLVRSINAPTDGFVFVIATSQANLTHVNGTDSFANFGVSDVSATFPSNQDVSARIDGAAASGIYSQPITVHGLFSVSAGTNTFYFVGREITAADVKVFEIQLSLLFFPTAYGVVEPTFTSVGDDVEAFGAAPSSPATASDIAAEQAEAQAFHLARVQREMDAMRARLERMQAEISKNAQLQGQP